MSLAIDVDAVTGVLLADGWHAVKGASFELDSYEYLWDREGGEQVILHGGGQSGVCATGFGFRDAKQDAWLFGPLTSILAVKVEP